MRAPLRQEGGLSRTALDPSGRIGHNEKAAINAKAERPDTGYLLRLDSLYNLARVRGKDAIESGVVPGTGQTACLATGYYHD